MKIVSIVGARPQFIKVQPIIKEIERRNKRRKRIQHILVHTGQHYDYEMSKIFFDELQIPKPHYNLGVGSGPHGWQTGEMLKKIESVLRKEKPNVVLVYGDTNSTLAGALAAAKLHVPIGHVEAGLRSYNRKMPEEHNRVLADHLSTFLFCPTETAVKNLRKEGVRKGVYLVGDVMYDIFRGFQKKINKHEIFLNHLNLKPKQYILATIHRAENTDDTRKLRSIIKALEQVSQKYFPVVLPLHPRTANAMRRLNIKVASLKVIKPVSYLKMLVLEKNAKAIITDSGGIQKEAYWFRVPCITLRKETEWAETVKTGCNIMCDSSSAALCDAVQIGFASIGFRNMRLDSGSACKRIHAILDRSLLDWRISRRCPI